MEGSDNHQPLPGRPRVRNGKLAEPAAAEAIRQDDAAAASVRAQSKSVRKGSWLAGIGFAAVTFGAAAIGAPASRRKPWYRTLRKSSATPPDWVFGPAWTILDASVAYSGWRTWRTPNSPARTRALRLWALQMTLNASWAPLFFGARRPKASAVVTAALVPAIAGYVASARTVDRTAANVMLPYLGWTAFATFLNVQILRKNAWRLQ